MRTKLVKRHWCDFCNKAGLSASHMSVHEKHCTMNPNRECRVCKMLEDGRDWGFTAIPLPQLVAMLPKGPFIQVDEGGLHEVKIDLGKVIATLRAASGDCPACIMAALRQAKIPVPMCAEWFDFTNEMREIWANINDARAEERGY